MILDQHEPIRLPDNLNARIWRYVDVHKLESIFRDRALYFCRGDRFEDPYEGLLPDDFIRGDDAEIRVRHLLYCRSHAYVNCWHLSEYESATMWKIYGARGVALKSTFSRLQHAFDGHRAANQLESIDVGLVQYDSDYLHQRLNIRKALFHKQPHFESEREVRACFHRLDDRGSGYFADPSTPISTLIQPTMFVPPSFELVMIDPERLVTGIVVDPTAPPSLVADVHDVVARNGVGIPIEKSSLNEVGYLTEMLAREPRDTL